MGSSPLMPQQELHCVGSLSPARHLQSTFQPGSLTQVINRMLMFHHSARMSPPSGKMSPKPAKKPHLGFMWCCRSVDCCTLALSYLYVRSEAAAYTNSGFGLPRYLASDFGTSPPAACLIREHNTHRIQLHFTSPTRLQIRHSQTAVGVFCRALAAVPGCSVHYIVQYLISFPFRICSNKLHVGPDQLLLGSPGGEERLPTCLLERAAGVQPPDTSGVPAAERAAEHGS